MQEHHQTSNSNTYGQYLESLLNGNRIQCSDIVRNQLQLSIPVKSVYEDIFRRSLYRVGELWEYNEISVALEHAATAITEGIMNEIFPQVVSQHRCSKKVVISCLEQEFHQVGGKMVADIFEMHGWDSYYLGANTPTGEFIRFIKDIQPHVVGISLSVYLHLEHLNQTLDAIRDQFPDIRILIGGQAFRFGGQKIAESYSNVYYLKGLDQIEEFIKSFPK